MTGTSTTASTTDAIAANNNFDPNASGVITATGGSTLNTIAVPEALTLSNKPVKNGDAVIYHDGGGSPIGGLTDGTKYYVVVVKPGYYELDSSQSDAQASSHSSIITLDPTKATGYRPEPRDHRRARQGRDRRLGRGQPRQRHDDDGDRRRRHPDRRA